MVVDNQPAGLVIVTLKMDFWMVMGCCKAALSLSLQTQ